MSRRTHVGITLVLMALPTACGGAGGDADTGASGSPEAAAERALPDGAEAISFLGDTLTPPPLPPQVLADRQARYREAEEALAAAPDDADALIWMGRRTAYLGRYRDAIDIYTHALTIHPDDARLYRHRGHRYLTVRDMDRAIEDLRRAAELTEGRPDEVEPDGLPNALGIPTSTLQHNIWYHLALAYYLSGDFHRAAEAYARSAAVPGHPDARVATAYWRYMTLARLGRDEEARAVLDGISGDEDVIEATGYLDLLRLFRGDVTPGDIPGWEDGDATLAGATVGYGVGMWHHLNGRPDEARRVWARVVSGRSQWAAFGYIAAEAELADPSRP